MGEPDVMGQPETTMFLVGELHRQGVSYQKIADEIGVTWMTVHRWAKGFSRPRPAHPVNIELARLLGEIQVLLAAKN